MQRFTLSTSCLRAAFKTTPQLVRGMQAAAIKSQDEPAYEPRTLQVTPAVHFQPQRHVNPPPSLNRTKGMAMMDGYFGKIEDLEPALASGSTGNCECSQCPEAECASCPYKIYSPVASVKKAMSANEEGNSNTMTEHLKQQYQKGVEWNLSDL